MVSVLPSARTPWDLIGAVTGQNLSQVLPGAVQQGYQRQQGLNAIDQLQEQLSAAGGDINKMLPALARAYTLNPNLERSGLGQTYLQQAKLGRAFPSQTGMGQIPQTKVQPQQQEPSNLPSSSIPQQSNFPTASPFNILIKDQMIAESERYAHAVQDPAAAAQRYAQLERENDTATSQRQALEDAALKAGVSPADLPRFMVVNQGLNPTNPSEWAQKAIRNFADVKNNDDALERAFIPGIGNGLLGQNRDEALKNLRGPVQRNAARGLEQEDRKYLSDNYLTPTEIESLYHPLDEKTEKAISKLPKGLFPAQKKTTWGEVGEILKGKLKTNPFVSYEETREKDPQALQAMQNTLTDFFANNVTPKTSLLGMREKIWEDKDYDWRQFGPAIREAEKKGLKLEPFQEREMATIETQPPIQSLPDIFKDMSRIPHFLRGAK